MPFVPEKFIDMAEIAVDSARTEASFRTAIGRAYYAVYGTMRVRLCKAKGYSAQQLFNSYGRHWKIVKAIEDGPPTGPNRFLAISVAYRFLCTRRGDSDYEYGLTIDRRDSQAAIRSAKRILTVLNNLADKDYKELPFNPP